MADFHSYITLSKDKIRAIGDNTVARIRMSQPIELENILERLKEQMHRKSFFGICGPFLKEDRYPTDEEIKEFRKGDFFYGWRVTREEHARYYDKAVDRIERLVYLLTQGDDLVYVSTADYSSLEYTGVNVGY